MADGQPGYGSHLGAEGEGKVIISGDLPNYIATPPMVPAQILLFHLIAHEIGHVMIGSGHPDQGTGGASLRWNMSFSNPAWRPDPRDKNRLMCSGNYVDFTKPGKQLIKKEWDLIEAWLKKQEDDGTL
jgi:hypothetical protein